MLFNFSTCCPAEPAKLAAVVYTYVDGMLEKRAPHRSEHLALLKTMTEEGACLLGERDDVAQFPRRFT